MRIALLFIALACLVAGAIGVITDHHLYAAALWIVVSGLWFRELSRELA